MWILQKVQDRAESLPVEISRLVGKSSVDISAKANLLNKLHSNVLTPDKIPDFFLPPRLSRRSLEAVENIVTNYLCENEANCSQNFLPKPNMTTVIKSNAKNKDIMVQLCPKKSIPFSLKSYESGFSESPNTRRKESLFHSTFSNYKLKHITKREVPRLPSITVLKVKSLESDTSLSADSSPYSSPPTIRSKHDKGFLSCSTSNESLQKEVPQSSRIKSESITKANHVDKVTSSTLAPPLQFPVDMLHCQEQLHSEHVLLFPHRGCIRLSACSVTRDQVTIRIRVISVEDMREPGDPRPLHCGLNLCLSPGKLQRQHSAIIRNCRNPVFNEDFFFTKPEGQELGLQDFSLRVKVLEKSSGLGRATVLGAVVKPLTELLAL
ncbi:C2 calcium-dependent domain-containing protein 4C [Trichomycterus rosablanca]|uniref:C2 calcium-dependent domain-containing protein 4C n=1 Tax=Trichomycterus rosablanca TaxID=2290929 RepID=UPI002F34FE22